MVLAFPAGKKRFVGDSKRASRSYPVARQIECLEPRQLLSNSWFVSPSGNNNNPGTLAAPFQSIQHAASVAQSGDKVEIETGVYHETITPAHSSVTFEAYNGETVTVSGADAVTGWSDSSGSIYSAPMSWDLGEGNNEVFVNGVGLNEAEYPNTAIGGGSHPGEIAMQSVKGHTIYNSSLSQPANYWKGAIIQMAPGQGWDGQTGTVTSSSPGSITISYEDHGQYAHPTAGNTFRLFGVYNALDTAGEWYRDPTSGKLYLWAPNGGDPGTQDVEAKARQYAFDLRNVSGTTINAVNIFSATIITGHNSTNTVINGISAQYISQQAQIPEGWYIRPTQGIMLFGANSVIENSTIAWSTGPGILSRGSGDIIKNNIIHDTDTTGGNTGAIQLTGSYNTVDHNTIYNSGRHGVVAEVTHATITYNTIHDISLQTTEAGGIYTEGTNGEGSVMAYNNVYSIHAGGYGATALFLDNNTSGWTVHDNVTSDADYALKMNFTSNNNIIYNNTLGATKLSINSNQQGNWNGVKIYNNVFTKPIVTTGGAKIYNNVFASSSSGGMGAGDFSSGAGGKVAVTPPTGSTSGGSTSGGSSSSGGTTSSPLPENEIVTVTPPVAIYPQYPVAAPIVTPAKNSTVSDLIAAVVADRGAVVAAIAQKKAVLLQLAATHQADVAAFKNVVQELIKARHTQSPADIATFTADAAQLVQTVKADVAAIVAHHQTDFAGISDARGALAAVLKALRTARHAAKK
jgi:hypothetical protein